VIFTQGAFFLFFLVVAAVHWLLRGNRARKAWLLAASYVFYGSWDWRYLGLIVFSTLVDYVAGLGIERASTKSRRRPWLYMSLAANLGVLAYFKYFNFFVENGVGLLNLFGLELTPMRLDVVLPVGISFYTFQSLSYSIDVYRSGIPTRKDLLDFSLFVAFFPQLVAGPIVRAKEFLYQLDTKRRLADVQFRACLTIFLFGFVKKACIADNLAPVVDRIYGAHSGLEGAAEMTGALGHWLGVFLFSIQLYCDFSGYSDMAIATAGLLGYQLVENFRWPFVARSVSEFWSRWHISLTSWIRDYLYIWLDAVWLRFGGRRSSPWRLYFALFGVFTAVGLWHGASWNFVLFGVNAGVFIVLETAGLLKWVTRRRWLAHPYVLLTLTVSAVFFRTRTLAEVGDFTGGLVGRYGGGMGDVDPLWWALVVGFAIAHVLMYRRFLHDFFRSLPDWAFAVVLGAATALALPWVHAGYEAFIYFQF
jgi:alginate O-acetyltransferase complex protein AlgI